jgi:hypothetical protein
MSERQKKTPDWMLERLALGELDAATAEAVRAQLRAEGRSPERALAAIAASNQQLLATHPAPRVAAEVQRRARARRSRLGWLLGAPIALAGLAAVVLTIAFPGPMPHPAGGDELESTRIKGASPEAGPRLFVYRHGAGGDNQLADGTAAARGDLLQLAYSGRAGGWVALLSIDGAGKVTVHWPERGNAAVPVADAREFRLPSSYELDDAPGFERFFLVRADAPFDIGPISTSARALAGRPGARTALLPLPLSYQQATFLLAKPRKEVP